VGYYQANERTGDVELGAVGRRAADLLHARAADSLSVAAVLNAGKMEAFYEGKVRVL
jgi:hypothetical protein